MKKEIRNIVAIALIAVLTSCNSSKETSSNQTTNRTEKPQGERLQIGEQTRGERPDTAQLLEQMDANKDDKLSKDEVKGPLEKDFSKIDTNDDGFLSKEELENARNPERQRPQGGRPQGGRN